MSAGRTDSMLCAPARFALMYGPSRWIAQISAAWRDECETRAIVVTALRMSAREAESVVAASAVVPLRA